MAIWMGFIGLCITAVVFGSIIKIVQMALQPHENIERIKHGYPTLSGAKKLEPDRVIDYTAQRGN